MSTKSPEAAALATESKALAERRELARADAHGKLRITALEALDNPCRAIDLLYSTCPLLAAARDQLMHEPSFSAAEDATVRELNRRLAATGFAVLALA